MIEFQRKSLVAHGDFSFTFISLYKKTFTKTTRYRVLKYYSIIKCVSLLVFHEKNCSILSLYPFIPAFHWRQKTVLAYSLTTWSCGTTCGPCVAKMDVRTKSLKVWKCEVVGVHIYRGLQAGKMYYCINEGIHSNRVDPQLP